MKYAILVYETAEDFAAREDQNRMQAYWGAYSAYSEALSKSGLGTGQGAGLLPPHAATTVRVRGGARQVVDGPFADTKEQLGGFFIIDAPDLDAAMSWAEKCPSVGSGSVEIRPLMAM